MNQCAPPKSIGTGKDRELNKEMPDIKLPFPRTNKWQRYNNETKTIEEDYMKLLFTYDFNWE